MEIQKQKKEKTGLKRKLDECFENLDDLEKEKSILMNNYENKINMMAAMEKEYGSVVEQLVNKNVWHENVSEKVLNLQKKIR